MYSPEDDRAAIERAKAILARFGVDARQVDDLVASKGRLPPKVVPSSYAQPQPRMLPSPFAPPQPKVISSPSAPPPYASRAYLPEPEPEYAAYNPATPEPGYTTHVVPQSHANNCNSLGFVVLGDLLEEKKAFLGPGEAADVICSPLGLALLLDMLQEGATGKTRDEITDWLGGDCYSRVDLAHLMPEGAGSIANSLWSRHAGSVNPAYAARLREKFGAEVFGELSTGAINSWVNAHTGGMIPKIIERVSSEAYFMLVNALWFSCRWLRPFDEDLSSNATFRGLAGPRPCRMMHRTGDLKCAVLPGGVLGCLLPLSAKLMKEASAWQYDEWDVVPQSSNLAVVVVVAPAGQELPAPEAAEETIRTAISRDARLWLPRSKLEQPPTTLQGVLYAHGLTACWEVRKELPAFGDEASLGDILQAAKLEFDERGAKGAAATSGPIAQGLGGAKRYLDIRCDHPFFVGVADLRSGAFLLAGYVL